MTARGKRTLIVGGALVVWMSLAAIAGNSLVLEVPASNPEAIVVLSGSADYRKRAETAARLWRENLSPTILITDDGHRGGWDDSLQRNPAYCELTERTLESEGVPPGNIFVIPGIVDGTFDEASAVTRYLGENGIRSVQLVTSGFHTRRTLLAFRRVAEVEKLEIKFGISCPTSDTEWWARSFWWISFAGWRNIPAELLKLAYYWWAH